MELHPVESLIILIKFWFKCTNKGLSEGIQQLSILECSKSEYIFIEAPEVLLFEFNNFFLNLLPFNNTICQIIDVFKASSPIYKI